MKKILKFIEVHPYKTVLICAAVANLIIWCLHTRALFGGIWGMVCHPVSALYNFCLLVGFYGIALFFRRRVFALSMISILWLGLGVTDFVLLGMRVMPLQAIDFYIFRTGFAIIGVYMCPLEILLSGLGILVCLFLLVLLFIKAPRAERLPLTQLLITALCFLLVFLLFSLAFIGLGNANPDNFDNVLDGTDAYGFPYCFLRSMFDRGIDRPENYSEATVREALSALAAREDTVPNDLPNVIFIQLESFFDVTRLSEIRFSEDPIPNFHALGNEGTFGTLRVPGIGSGTVNTEFEVLTGLPLDLFGTGEYPYQSILREKSCETIAHDLAALGYSTHAFHNHTSAFYDRYRVYDGLGFDDFTGAEYMKDLTYNELSWEKDEILTSYIIKALDSTESLDFVFAVTVEGHGGYPEIAMEGNTIRVEGAPSEALTHAYEYYASTLRETDRFLGELVEALKARDEETILVLYGDHLPTLDLTAEDFTIGDLLTTDYVIWSTKGLPTDTQKARALTAPSLFPYTFERLGLDVGLVPRVWKAYEQDNTTLLETLKLLGYDTLYGKAVAYGEPFPFERHNMRLGLEPIRITSVHVTAEKEAFVIGENFTPSSHVFVNGHRVRTTFLSENTLHIEQEKLEIGDEISVIQISTDLRRLSECEKFVVTQQPTPIL